MMRHLDFDVRVRAVNRGRQTRRRTVPAQSAAGGGGRRLAGRDRCDVVHVVVVPTEAEQPQRVGRTGRDVLDDDPHAPDHRERQ